jgi:hypothetical protein
LEKNKIDAYEAPGFALYYSVTVVAAKMCTTPFILYFYAKSKQEHKNDKGNG